MSDIVWPCGCLTDLGVRDRLQREVACYLFIRQHSKTLQSVLSMINLHYVRSGHCMGETTFRQNINAYSLKTMGPGPRDKTGLFLREHTP